MAISGTVKIKNIGGISPWGEGWNHYMNIEVEDMEISEAFKADEIVNEYQVDDLLEAIGEWDVAKWLSEQGYEVSK
ncbi:hypothetical protein [Lelliottia amnigena]|uniref:hypothetical protein n=1 Tax=Lelliottia amnigena TaxID=61646 RepID=UPI001C22C130|nr:hypothetical protein [Lelliottia amnigena]QXB19833.1 hypothetical protein I6L76_11210 [Lelliottia amnigena]